MALQWRHSPPAAQAAQILVQNNQALVLSYASPLNFMGRPYGYLENTHQKLTVMSWRHGAYISIILIRQILTMADGSIVAMNCSRR